MQSILITGATGTIGMEVVRYLYPYSKGRKIRVGARSIQRSRSKLRAFPGLEYRLFDFEDSHTFQEAFKHVEILFLMRPPHISRVQRVFLPLLREAKAAGIQKVVFLSVQGAERSSIIPHRKIEQLIEQLGLNFIFIRPSYFMQNLTTVFLRSITQHQRIELPLGKAKLNWVDSFNVSEYCAQVLLYFNQYQNRAFDITGTENKNFQEVVELIQSETGIPVRYKSINPFSFFIKKVKEGHSMSYALVFTLLHFLPRLQAEPKISQVYENLTGKKPTSLQEFLSREKPVLRESTRRICRL
ncbi:NmrA family NAD(P)-binding protein [Croceiramulus getboli]|nr:NmrA family NAD(P)-binding protein [Flavobacteriaceae bacterium YJPT1-3]